MTVWSLNLDYGLVEIAENGTVESIAEKPILDKWINIRKFQINLGYRDFVFSHNSFSPFQLDATNMKSINVFRHQGLHITVNTLSELEEAQSHIKSNEGQKKNLYWSGVKVFITGINGFVGGNVAEKLVELGADVYGLIRTKKYHSYLYYEKLYRNILN